MKVAKCLLISAILVLMLPGIAEALVVVGTHTSLSASKTKVTAGTPGDVHREPELTRAGLRQGPIVEAVPERGPRGNRGYRAHGFVLLHEHHLRADHVCRQVQREHRWGAPEPEGLHRERGGATVTICVPHPPPPRRIRIPTRIRHPTRIRARVPRSAT